MAKTKRAASRKPKVERPTLGQRIIKGLEEATRHFKGEDVGAKVTRVKITPLIRCVRELRAARDGAGMTLADVSERSGLRLETLSRLELGKVQNPTVDTLIRYADAVGYQLSLALVEADVE